MYKNKITVYKYTDRTSNAIQRHHFGFEILMSSHNYQNEFDKCDE